MITLVNVYICRLSVVLGAMRSYPPLLFGLYLYHQIICRGFSGGPVGKTSHFECKSMDSIPGQGTKILHDAWCSQKTFLGFIPFLFVFDFCVCGCLVTNFKYP